MIAMDTDIFTQIASLAGVILRTNPQLFSPRPWVVPEAHEGAGAPTMRSCKLACPAIFHKLCMVSSALTVLYDRLTRPNK